MIWRVLLADEHEVFRVVARRCLEAERRVDLVAVTHTVQETRTALQAYSPNLVFLDTLIFGRDGFDEIARLKRQAQAPRVVLTAGRSAPAHRDLALTIGVDGVIDKEDFVRELSTVLDAISYLNKAAAD
jgi:DNA-binding NarL/FixJ family response regulator